MVTRRGSLSISSGNIFPVIKKWLYSDHDILYKELTSSGRDAVTKLKELELMGEYTKPEDLEYKIQVTVDPNEKSITFTDNGIGTTADEAEKYINQIAFSGVQDFLEKCKDKVNEDQIIGHFGLGFYSAFTVADRVTTDTSSFQGGATPVCWESEGGTELKMDDGIKEVPGTTIALYLNEDSMEFSNEYRAREVIEKYCAFMPVSVFLDNVSVEPQYETIERDELTDKDITVEMVVEKAKIEEKENENGEKEVIEISPATEKYKILKRPAVLNDVNPLWNKHPNECTEDEYKTFYRKVLMDYKEPLSWIHLNMDYPFNLKGIPYFPKINTEYDSLEGTIKLYNNQVFIADNTREVIPEFLMLLKGVTGCPDLPLNVSRSALQNGGFVKKISDYITKRVADKLSGMCKADKEAYEKYWDDISPFIRFGCLRGDEFEEKMKDYILFKNPNKKYLTPQDCLGENKEKHEDATYYVMDEKEQSRYINVLKEAGLDAVLLGHNIDSPFIGQLEQKNEGLKLLRIDADVTDIFKEEVAKGSVEAFKADTEKLTETFKKAFGNDKLEIKAEELKNADLASMITVSEENRRMQDMMKMYNTYGMDPSMSGGAGGMLVLNANNSLVQYVLGHGEGASTEKICQQLYDLMSLGHGSPTPERMTKLIARINETMGMIAGQEIKQK